MLFHWSSKITQNAPFENVFRAIGTFVCFAIRPSVRTSVHPFVRLTYARPTIVFIYIEV